MDFSIDRLYDYSMSPSADFFISGPELKFITNYYFFFVYFFATLLYLPMLKAKEMLLFRRRHFLFGFSIEIQKSEGEVLVVLS